MSYLLTFIWKVQLVSSNCRLCLLKAPALSVYRPSVVLTRNSHQHSFLGTELSAGFHGFCTPFILTSLCIPAPAFRVLCKQNAWLGLRLIRAYSVFCLLGIRQTERCYNHCFVVTVFLRLENGRFGVRFPLTPGNFSGVESYQ